MGIAHCRWRLKWNNIIMLFDFPPAIRKAIYTTNVIESINRVIRSITPSRGTVCGGERPAE